MNALTKICITIIAERKSYEELIKITHKDKMEAQTDALVKFWETKLIEYRAKLDLINDLYDRLLKEDSPEFKRVLELDKQS